MGGAMGFLQRVHRAGLRKRHLPPIGADGNSLSTFLLFNQDRIQKEFPEKSSTRTGSMMLQIRVQLPESL
jgi:hypothetical protein